MSDEFPAQETLPASSDFLVVGSGIGGLTAAIVAKDLGLDVLVLEKAAVVGGTSAYSMGLIWAPANKYAHAVGLQDSAEDAIAHVRELSGARHDEAMLAAYIRLISDAMEHLEKKAQVPFELVPHYPDYCAERVGGKMQGRYVSCPVFASADSLSPEWQQRLFHSPYYRTLPASWKEVQSFGGLGNVNKWQQQLLDNRAAKDYRGFGSGVMGFLLRACLQRKIPIIMEISADSLIVSDGRVSGVTGTFKGHAINIAARRGVILATGGYDSNANLQARLDPHPVANALGAPTVDGSGIIMAMEIGAAFEVLDGQLLVPTYRIPNECVDGRPLWRMFVREPSLPGSIIVNAAGERFADESFYRHLTAEMAHFDKKNGRYPNYPAFFIFDEQWRQRYKLGPLGNGEQADWICSGANAAELAAALNIDAAGLVQTLDHFNADAARGEDPIFGRGSHAFGRHHGDPAQKPNPCLAPLTPPFYGFQVELGTSGTNSGLRVDEYARVKDLRGEPIRGLYAAGNCMANLVEGLWYNSGTANGRGLAFGFAAARHAAGMN